MPTVYAIPDEGLSHLLDWMIRDPITPDHTLELRIFANNITPSRTSVLASFTEATFAGYSRRTLTRAGWTPAEVEDDHVARSHRAAGGQTYLVTGDFQTVYGIYLVEPSLGVVIAAQRFLEPIDTAVTQTFTLDPIVTLRSESYTT